ncbi:MAG: transcriptional repressor NrdR [Gammaproteobacteria bacterium]|nr:transcriptional repressor NrdR [Gammaproteobacteria bacterium]
MKCLFCNSEDTQVIDTRLSDDKMVVKRRRRCFVCDKRFNTLEKIDLQMPAIIKSNTTRQEYDAEKIRSSMMLALHKRPVSLLLVDEAIDNIRQTVINLGEREIKSRLIGDLVMTQLSKLDKVAYIRFASVYRSFKDVTDFSDIIEQVYQTKKGD